MCWLTRLILKNLKYGSDFPQNALVLGWAVAQGAYKVVLTKMEAGWSIGRI